MQYRRDSARVDRARPAHRLYRQLRAVSVALARQPVAFSVPDDVPAYAAVAHAAAALDRPLLDVPRLRRRIDAARLAVATAIFTAALWAWDGAVPADTRIAALAFAGAAAWTAIAFAGRTWQGAVLRATLAAQVAVDLLLATASVHVTGGAASQFAALYVLAITEAALLLPTGGAFLAAAGACALYSAEVIRWRPVHTGAPGVALALQLGVFAAVALGATLVGARLRQAGSGGEQLAAALARARHEARIEASDVLRNMPSGIVTVDAAGRLLFANPAAAALLGVPGGHTDDAVELLSQLRLVAPALGVLITRAAVDGQRTIRAEVAVARGDGTSATVGVTTTASDGVATAIFSDITDTKRVAALHLRAERLEAVAELAASLAHEIRNPLASIRSAVEQLAGLATRAPACDAADPDDVRGDVRTLAALTVRESDRLSRLLGEFLDFTRARVTRLESLDLTAAVRAAAGLAAAHPDASRVRVAVTEGGPAAGDALVDADPELLHRALFNLVLNATQAARSAVTVGVHVPHAAELPVGLAFASGALAVRVSDDGGGVPSEVTDRLFEPFVTTKAGGSGLGLAIVQRAVEAHGGVVLVDAGGAGRGASFTVVLPRAGSRIGRMDRWTPAVPLLAVPPLA